VVPNHVNMAPNRNEKGKERISTCDLHNNDFSYVAATNAIAEKHIDQGHNEVVHHICNHGE